MMYRPIVLSVVLLGVMAVQASAADKNVEASLLASADAAVPGQAFSVGVRLKMRPHWHTYWVNPGETGEATRIKLSGPAGFEFGPIQWPLPSRIEAPGGVSFGYEDEVLLMVPARVAKDVAVGGEAKIVAKVSWLACKDQCINGEAELTMNLPIAAQSSPASAEIFALWQGRLPVELASFEPTKGPFHFLQPAGPQGTLRPELRVQWFRAPKKVEWFPVATEAIAIEHVSTMQDGKATLIKFKSKVYKPDPKADGRADSVLVYEDEAGRHGVVLPIRILK